MVDILSFSPSLPLFFFRSFVNKKLRSFLRACLRPPKESGKQISQSSGIEKHAQCWVLRIFGQVFQTRKKISLTQGIGQGQKNEKDI